MSDWKWRLEPTPEGLLYMIEIMNCGILLADKDGIIQYANPRTLEWTGYEPTELDGKPTSMLVPPELREPVSRERAQLPDGGGRTLLGVMQRKDGSTFPVAVAPQPFERLDNREIAVLNIITDLGAVQTARPIGAQEQSLASDLAQVALKLQSMSFSAAISAEASLPVDHPLVQELSAREREVLEALVKGARVPSIAKELFISQSTVRNHLKSIFRKLNVSSQSELIERVRALRTPNA